MIALDDEALEEVFEDLIDLHRNRISVGDFKTAVRFNLENGNSIFFRIPYLKSVDAEEQGIITEDVVVGKLDTTNVTGTTAVAEPEEDLYLLHAQAWEDLANAVQALDGPDDDVDVLIHALRYNYSVEIHPDMFEEDGTFKVGAEKRYQYKNKVGEVVDTSAWNYTSSEVFAMTLWQPMWRFNLSQEYINEEKGGKRSWNCYSQQLNEEDEDREGYSDVYHCDRVLAILECAMRQIVSMYENEEEPRLW